MFSHNLQSSVAFSPVLLLLLLSTPQVTPLSYLHPPAPSTMLNPSCNHSASSTTIHPLCYPSAPTCTSPCHTLILTSTLPAMSVPFYYMYSSSTLMPLYLSTPSIIVYKLSLASRVPSSHMYIYMPLLQCCR